MNPQEYLIYDFLQRIDRPQITQQIIEGIKPNSIEDIEEVLKGMRNDGHLIRKDFSRGRDLWFIKS